MTFHPAMDYGRGHHKSARALPEEGPAFSYTPEKGKELMMARAKKLVAVRKALES